MDKYSYCLESYQDAKYKWRWHLYRYIANRIGDVKDVRVISTETFLSADHAEADAYFYLGERWSFERMPSTDHYQHHQI